MLKSITIHDIARELKITSGTVSRALNDNPRISSETIRLVKEKAKELKYQRNAIATSLRSGKSHTIGVMIPSAQMNFFGSVVRGIEMISSSLGFNILLYQSEESASLEKKGIEVFLEAKVDGILASIAKETTNYSHFKDLSEKAIPLVLFDRTFADFNVPTVVIDDYKGAFNATEHLINVGYKRIAHVSGPQQLSNFNNRLQGYLAALRANKIPIDNELIYSGDLSIQCGIESVEYFFGLKEIPDAVFAAEDFSALGIIKGLKDRKVNMPNDFGVIGFANETFGEHISPSLSSVDQQTVEMGKTAAGLLIKMINSSKTETIQKIQDIILEPLLKIRESTAVNLAL
jgi:LacI family transcriptional regulator